jgi:hypothetical protein
MAAISDVVPTPYRRGIRPSLPGSEGVYLEEELRRVEQTLADVLRAVPQVVYMEPTNPGEGMIRYAKAPWNPLGTGDAWVTYKAGVWVAL